MITISCKNKYLHLSDDSKVSSPFFFCSCKDENDFFESLEKIRKSANIVDYVKISGKHMRMLYAFTTVPQVTPTSKDHEVVYTGDLASFIVHNYVHWIIDI